MATATIIFYIFLALTGLSALFIMLSKNILYSAFALIVTFLGMAGIFVLLGAEFVAITQILVYVGGVLILIVFGIMLTQRTKSTKVETEIYHKFFGVLVAVGLFYILTRAISLANFEGMGWIQQTSETVPSSVKSLGLKLMTDYVLAFEVIGILLLIALIGAVRIAGNTREEVEDAA